MVWLERGSKSPTHQSKSHRFGFSRELDSRRRTKWQSPGVEPLDNSTEKGAFEGQSVCKS